jgi:hypothetical protein
LKDEGTPIPSWQQAVDDSLHLADAGHVFTHAWVEERLGLGPKPLLTEDYEQWEFQRLAAVESWRKALLLDHGIHIENVRGEGYRVIAQHETARVAVALARRDASKAINQAAVKIVNARTADLSMGGVRERHDALAYLGKLHEKLRTARPKPPKPGQAHR